MDTSLTTQARDALKENNVAVARWLLRLQVARCPDDPSGWYWLFQVAEQRAEGIECLQNLLRIAQGEMPTAPVSPTALRAEPLIENNLSVAPEAAPELEALPSSENPAPMPVAIAAPPPGAKALARKSTTPLPPKTSLQPKWQLFRQALSWAANGVGVVVVCVVAAVVVPILFGNRALVIISGSMMPTIATGAVVIVRPIPANMLKQGDVIAFSPNAEAKLPWVHRIVNIREEAGVRYYTTQGDANSAADPGEVVLPQTAWRVWYSVPLVGYVVNFAGSREGVWLMVVLPVLGLGTLFIKDRLGLFGKKQVAVANS